jgi:hypothetical protein
VDRSPKRIESADLQHGEIKGAKFSANLAEAFPFPRVGAVINAVLGARKSKGSP